MPSPKGRPPRPKPEPPAAKAAGRRSGLPQLLAVVVGAYSGLVAYGLWGEASPLRPAPAGAPVDARSALFVRDLEAKPGSDGLLHLHGQVHNRAQVALQRATFTVRLKDATGQVVNSVEAEVGPIPAGGQGPLEATAAVQGAAGLEVEAKRARFAPAP